MRPLTPNEKFLLTILGLIAFAGINFFGYRALSQRQATAKMDDAQLRADQAEAKVSLLQSSLWDKREEWINTHLPPGGDEGDAKAQTLQAVLVGARGRGLQVLEQSLNDTLEEPTTFQVQITLTVKGSMQSLAQWLAGLQDPASFYAVPFISLKADNDQKALVCTVHISRYFRKAKA